MKRALALLVGGVLILGSALAAHAQAPTVSFGGQMRIYGFAVDNITDFRDSNQGLFRDSNSFYFQRFRLFTTIESADKKARAYWALEVGDITWGTGGGANANSTVGCVGQAPFVPTVSVPGITPGATTSGTVSQPGSTTRVGNGAGGCLGADGVNVETKNIYLWLDTAEWVPGTSVLLGIGNIVFLNSPIGAFADDDAATIQLNWKSPMVDVQAWLAKIGEGASTANADDTNAYALRVGVNITKDMRVTLEGLMLDEQSMTGQNLGDTFWIGATFSGKFGDILIDAQGVYGQRTYIAAAGTGANTFDESGWGGFVLVRAPIGPLNLNGIGWYTSGDDTRPPGGGAAGAGSNTVRLTKDSDKLPGVWNGGGWFNGGGAYMGEWILGLSTIGNPGPAGVAGTTFGDPTGTYGVGASAIYNFTPALSVGGGVAYIGASDAKGVWGDWVFEIDAGVQYKFNPNVTLNLFGGYMIPDEVDNAWGVAFRTVYSF